MSIFNYFVKQNNISIPLSQYNKKIILIVNVASECGLTDNNYKKLQTLYENYSSKSFIILGFPCNQFGHQESKSNEEIREFVKSYNVTFPILDKVDVNGKNEIELYHYLKKDVKDKSFLSYINNDILWNFTKFLCIDGVPYHRFEPTTSIEKVEEYIKKYIDS